MKNLLIGSRALNYWDSSLKIKDTTDYDVISDNPIEGTEWHKPEDLNNYEISDYVSKCYITLNGHKLYIVNMKGLAIIKRSHLWRHLGFQKHITQYHKHGLHKEYLLLRKEDEPVFSRRLKSTKDMFPINAPTLNKTKQEFFNDGIYRKYDHDYLHELISYNKYPLYKLLQIDDNEIQCDFERWYTLSTLNKLKCVAEEVYVTALERFILVDNSIPYKLAYIKSLDKVCTTMCSGWFRDFAIDYYPYILKLYDRNKIKNVINILGDN